jgi:hypothetical protein
MEIRQLLASVQKQDRIHMNIAVVLGVHFIDEDSHLTNYMPAVTFISKSALI